VTDVLAKSIKNIKHYNKVFYDHFESLVIRFFSFPEATPNTNQEDHPVKVPKKQRG